MAKIEMKCPSLFQLHDTTIYKTHDTIVYYHDTFTSPAETHTDTFNIPCPDHASVIKHFKGGSATVSVNKGQVIVICHEDSMRHVIQLKDSIIEVQKTIIKSGLATKTITVIAPKTTFEGFCQWFTILVLLAVAGYFGIKYLPGIISAFKPKL